MRRFIVICILFLLLSFFLTSSSIAWIDEQLYSSENVLINQNPGSRQDETWIITGHEEIIDDSTIFYNSITIRSGGVLQIENSTIKINSSVAAVIITVELGGALIINNSNLTSLNTSNDEGYSIKVHGILKISNSEINYLCYKTDVCQIETCGGVEYKNYYSPGIEIYSDDVEITDSEIEFAKNTSIYISNANPKILGNTFSNNIRSIAVINSELTISENLFESNFFGIEIFNSNVEIKNQVYSQNYELSIYGDNSKIIIDNITSEYSNIIMSCLESSVTINNSLLLDSYGLWFDDSAVEIYNTSIVNVDGGILFNNVTVDIEFNTIESCDIGIQSYYSNEGIIKNNSFSNCTRAGVEIWNSIDMMLINNLVYGGYSGILIYYSDVEIYDNIVEGGYLGIGNFASSAIIKNNQISHNLEGLGLFESESQVISNTITNNEIGIMCHDSFSNIMSNLIANNTGWGINITNVDPQLDGNIFNDTIHEPNGQGRIRRSAEVWVNVEDSYENKVKDAIISINSNTSELIQKYTGSGYTFYLPIYEILNSGDKREYNPYTITASWGTVIIGYTTASETVELLDAITVNLTLQLPDLYVTTEDIEISNMNPKHGDKIEFKLKIHYSSTQIRARDINVSLTADGGIIRRFTVSFNGSAETQNQTIIIPWEVIAFKSGAMDIRATIDPINSLENQILNYDENNIANKTINVEGKQLRSGQGFSFTQLCGIFLIVIAIIILLLIGLMYRRRAKTLGEYKVDIDEIDSGSVPEIEGDKLRKSPPVKPKKDSKAGELKTIKEKKNDSEKQGTKSGSGDKAPREVKSSKDDKVKKPVDEKKRADKKSLKEKLTEDLNRDVAPRIKW